MLIEVEFNGILYLNEYVNSIYLNSVDCFVMCLLINVNNKFFLFEMIRLNLQYLFNCFDKNDFVVNKGKNVINQYIYLDKKIMEDYFG